MGHRLEIACEPASAERMIAIAKSFDIDARVVGRIEAGPPGNHLKILVEGQTLETVARPYPISAEKPVEPECGPRSRPRIRQYRPRRKIAEMQIVERTADSDYIF